MSQDSQPTTVPSRATPVGAVRARWAWTAPEVWTERMLTALDQGVRGGRWHTLIDKVYALPTLRAAFARVKANRGAPGVDHVTVAMFEARLDANLAAVSDALRTGTYRPQPIRRHWIPKGPRERRPLGIPTVRDRVVQTALRLVLEPIFETTFAPHSYGFRPGRSAKQAVRRVVTLLRAGYRYVVDADLQAYFDSIPHAPLRTQVRAKVSDARVLALVDAFLQQPIFEGLMQWTVDEGTPQGAVVTPRTQKVTSVDIGFVGPDRRRRITPARRCRWNWDAVANQDCVIADQHLLDEQAHEALPLKDVERVRAVRNRERKAESVSARRRYVVRSRV